MKIRLTFGIAAAIVGLMALASVPSMAEKHDSNTLHKLGNAIQYPVRKSTENLSVDVHRGVGHKSIVSNRPQNNHAVVTAQGNEYTIHHTYAHRQMMGSRGYWHNRRHYQHRSWRHGHWVYW